MSQSCAIAVCKRASRALCQCCNQYLCRDHFIEHDDLLNLKLNPLVDQINELADRLTGFDLNKLRNSSLEKLNQWREDYHHNVEIYYEQKCEEVNRFIEKILNTQREEIAQIRLQISELIDKQETTHNDIKSLTSSIDILKRKMNEIEQMSIKINITPSIINNDLINFTETKPHQLDLSTLPSPSHVIPRSDKSSTALASNDQYLLIHQNSYLCLINDEFSITKQRQWTSDSIIHMCWSSTLNSFILITAFDVFLISEDLLSIKCVETIIGRFWQSCACSNTSLYLSTGAWDSSIREYSLTPSIKFIKHWKLTENRIQKQRIDNIVYNNKTLALTINNEFNQMKFLELRSIDTFNRIWSCRIDIDYNETVIRCCLLSYNEWLVIDWKTSKLLHITNNGKVKECCSYKSEPLYTNCFLSNVLVISTNKTINFHKL
jgi:polyhydroxyalkanoate synthesis regulator phasin